MKRVSKCWQFMAHAAGLGLEGLYRISGRKAAGQKMVQDIELDEEKFQFGEQDDVHAVANILKQCEYRGDGAR